MPNDAPHIAFLGIVERFQHVRDGGTGFLKSNLLGLKPTVISPIFPCPLIGPQLAFAFYHLNPDHPFSLRITDDADVEVSTMAISMNEFVPAKAGPPAASVFVEGGPLFLVAKAWTFTVLRANQLNVLILRPGAYNILLRDDDQETLVGQLFFVLAEPEPLTDARRLAIRSDPSAARAVRIEAQCKECQEAMRVYAGLERVVELEGEGCVWFENLPDSYACSCGKTKLDLTIWRRNLHGLLGVRLIDMGSGMLVPLYESGALKNIHANFAALLAENAREETFQRFLEENPVLLHQFSPEKIFFKAPILSLRKTDFAIVNHQHELILIELEKPNTRLLKEDGNIHSELQHALGQPAEWLHHADEHRLALLQCIGVEQKEVGGVRAVVIAGRDAGYNPEHLRRLKGDVRYGRVKVITYDDLLANFGTLVRRVESL